MENQKIKMALPTKEQQAWQDLEIGMFIHWTPATFVNKKSNDRIDIEEINLTNVDTENWVKTAVSMGAKYIIMVAKHFQGFCMWQTETTPYSIKNVPWKNGKGDVIAELSENCRKYGLKLGVYLSPRDDFYHIKTTGVAADSKKQAIYDDIYRKQLTELLTQYGDMMEIWFDGSMTADIDDIMDQYGKGAMVFNSKYSTIRWVGNEDGFATDPAWNAVSKEDAIEGNATIRHGNPNADVWLPIECDAMINGGWWWRENNEDTLKSLEHLMNVYYRSVGHGAVLLLNNTPDRNGVIPEADANRSREFGDEIKRRFGKDVAKTNGEGNSLELDFKIPTKIDHIITMEDIAYGERIRVYRLEALIDNVWTVLCNGTAIGHKKIDYFKPITVEKIKLVVVKSSDTPIIRSFCAYDTGVDMTKNMIDPKNDGLKIGEWGYEIFYGLEPSDTKEITYDIADFVEQGGEFKLKFVQTGGENELSIEYARVVVEDCERPKWITIEADKKSIVVYLPGVAPAILVTVGLKCKDGFDTKGLVFFE